MKKALLVIDMQNIYSSGEDWACKDFEDAIKYIEKLIKEFSKSDIFFTKFKASDNPIGVWMEYNEVYKHINENYYLNDYTDKLKKYLTNDNLFIKDTYSSLKNKDLYDKLKFYDLIYVTGVTAGCCVLSTVFELIDMGKKIVYCTKGIAALSEGTEEAVINILKGLSPLHVIIK